MGKSIPCLGRVFLRASIRTDLLQHRLECSDLQPHLCLHPDCSAHSHSDFHAALPERNRHRLSPDRF